MKILTVVGARPQFVKAAVLSRKIQQTEGMEEILVHTGQHFDDNMSEIFFKEMSIPKPNYSLKTGGKSHGVMTGQMMMELEPIVVKEKPDILLVYGDTNSTLAGALVAAKLHIPIAHVEAGLRSFNMNMPEEINRILTDRISQWLFCPTGVAKKNLLGEGLAPEKIHVVGDIMYDAALYYKKSLQPTASVRDYVDSVKKFSLCTIHRAENTDDPKRLGEIFSALSLIAKENPLFLPLHPRTRNKVAELKLSTENINVVSPVGYGDILYLLNNCKLVLTDSGGMQKEAYFFNKPCITLRDETEWVETVESGVNVLVGGKKEKILSAFEKMNLEKIEFPETIYGDGHTAEKIIGELLRQKWN